MKKFREEELSEEIGVFSEHERTNIIDEAEKNINEENSYKRFEENEEKDAFITPSMKNFRKVIGVLFLLFMVYFGALANKVGTANYKTNLVSGKTENVKVGDMLSKETLKLEPKDFSIESATGYGKIELSIWNFSSKEDGDYVQVFVDGSPHTEPFAIRHKAVKIGVPDKGVIQVRGIRDGSNNGITYAVFFNKTGETYLNTVPLNASNIYTLKNIK
ncbi:hypothetical protein HAHI6034_10335 [Hathewaya histolytica]|uniref:Uncharacterized protein n=1 Tax=Hathewaya histolytica TaxID=1498 RepID=A0A4U9R6A8_HATHI|nr:hypothetical protein [Hathewaya histolytica]VTQ86258.1 Uncharacterised protein [Hathewaya histolytica]